MKKVVLTVVAVIAFGLSSLGQVGPQLGGHLGIPTGDTEDATSLNLGLDASYLWWVSDSFYAGLSTGYTTWLLKDEFDGDNLSFIPVAATGNVILGENWLLGADVGYGIGLNDGNDGGFYYQPKLGYSFNQNTNLFLGYKSITLDANEDGDDFNSGAIGLGVRFGLTSY